MQSTTLLRPTGPSCIPFAQAITNLFPLSPNPYTSSFIFSPSITHFPSFFKYPALILCSTSSPSFLFLTLSLTHFLSSNSHLTTLFSTPIPLPSSYLSRSLSGVGEAEYYLEKIGFMRHADVRTHTYAHKSAC